MKTNNQNNNVSSNNLNVSDDVKVENVDNVNTNLEGFQDMGEFLVAENDASATVSAPVMAQIRITKPNKQKFFKVRGGNEWSVVVNVIEIKEDNEYYIVLSSLVPYLQDEVKKIRLVFAYYLDGTPFLIPVTMPDESTGKKWNSWFSSLDTILKLATGNWVRAVANKSANGYQPILSIGKYPEPKIPQIIDHKTQAIRDFTMMDCVKMAFDKGREIRDLEHPVVKLLKGAGVMTPVDPSEE